MEPICEAKFSENSNGFRPNRSAETAIAQCMRLIQVQHMYHVVDLDIKGFFDNIKSQDHHFKWWFECGPLQGLLFQGPTKVGLNSPAVTGRPSKGHVSTFLRPVYLFPLDP